MKNRHLAPRRGRGPAPAAWLIGCAVSLMFATGCDGLTYVAHVAEGQFGIQGQTEPIDDVLASGRLTETEADKLRLIKRARLFAGEQMGLDIAGAYETYYDTGDAPLAWNLSAAEPDRLEPVTWSFPVVGSVPYLAFFDEAYLREVEQDLIDDGFDTLTYELDAYSTLGIFDDPVRSTMLERGDLSLVETIIHELLHNTIWTTASTEFNESLATFVGRQGAVDFLVAEFGEDSGWPETARDFYGDLDRVNDFLLTLFRDLEAFYAQDLPVETLVAGREAVFAAARVQFSTEILPTLNYPDSFSGYAELPTNNAWMLANYRYNLRLDAFAQVYESLSGDWSATLAVFRDAADAERPFDYLDNWLRSNTDED